MGDQLVDFVRSIYVPWELGDFSSSDWADEQIEFIMADGPSPDKGIGLEGMAKVWREMLNAWEGLTVEVEDVKRLDKERVLVLIHNRGRGRTSGVDVEQIASRGANLVEVRNGKVTRIVAYWHRERAFEELGLDPAELSSSQPP